MKKNGSRFFIFFPCQNFGVTINWQKLSSFLWFQKIVSWWCIWSFDVIIYIYFEKINAPIFGGWIFYVVCFVMFLVGNSNGRFNLVRICKRWRLKNWFIISRIEKNTNRFFSVFTPLNYLYINIWSWDAPVFFFHSS